jgi:branched-chain amino acid transport system substrate-binding protein
MPSISCGPSLTPKIAILSQNDDFGRDYVAGFKRGLGDKAATMIVLGSNLRDISADHQLAACDAEGLRGQRDVRRRARQVHLADDQGRCRDQLEAGPVLRPTSASSISFLEPAGLDNAVGLISSSNVRTRWTRNGPMTPA